MLEEMGVWLLKAWYESLASLFFLLLHEKKEKERKCFGKTLFTKISLLDKLETNRLHRSTHLGNCYFSQGRDHLMNYCWSVLNSSLWYWSLQNVISCRWFYSFIHSSSKHLSSIFCVPGTVLSHRHKVVNKSSVVSVLMQPTIRRRR